MGAQMSFEEFTATIATGTPPARSTSPGQAGADLALLALWHEARGEWDRAHELAQAAGGRDGDWVHAYLHRKEGDVGNAGYWYARAGRPAATGSLAAEWEAIARELIGG